MSGHGLVTDVEQVSAKQGEAVWQVVTDADNRSADGLNRCAVWIPRPGPAPVIGESVTWGPHHVEWAGFRVSKVDHEFDPEDPALFTG